MKTLAVSGSLMFKEYLGNYENCKVAASRFLSVLYKADLVQVYYSFYYISFGCWSKINKNRVLLNPPTTDPPTTDQPTTDHLPTDPPTHRPTNPPTTDPPIHWPSTHRPKIHRPTHKTLFQRLDNQKIFILQNTNTAGKM